MYKEIGYAYTTSTFGGEDGCYYVAVKEDQYAPTRGEEIMGKFKTKMEAEIFAASLPYQTGLWSSAKRGAPRGQEERENESI